MTSDKNSIDTDSNSKLRQVAPRVFDTDHLSRRFLDFSVATERVQRHRKSLLRVNRRLFSNPMKTSLLGGLADETCDEVDIRLLISAVGRRADVACQGLSGPFKARKRHSRSIKRHRTLTHCDAGGGSRPLHQTRTLLNRIDYC